MKGGVRKRGQNWYYYFDLGIVNGKRKKIERKAEGAKTKPEAEMILRRKIIEYENAGTIFKVSEITVHDYLMFWQQEYVALKLKPNTQYNYEQTIRNHILPHLGKYKLKTLTPEVLQKFFNLKVKEGWARQTLNIMFGIMSKALKHAVYPYKRINETPMQYVELMKETSRKPTKEDLKIQSIENLQKLSNYFCEGHTFHIPFQLGMHTGIRVGEMCGLEWRHVDLDKKTIEIEQQMIRQKDESIGKYYWTLGPPKSKSGYRIIAIGNTLVEILKKEKLRQKQNTLKYGEFYIKSDLGDFVCKKDNGEIITTSISKYNTRKACEKLKIQFNYHSLRHTHATMLIENGTPIKTVQKRLGHSRTAITEDRYVHLTQKMARDAADVFDSIAKNL
ncbi:site-specific integrase [Bacillus thuringiensis]|nr:site-specific integrase [Bacillus thuringiensis]